MKNKAPLALMEQLVMLLVFALAAALCLQAFVMADQMSGRNARKDAAILCVQDAAETVKACRGDLHAAQKILGGETDGTLLTVSSDDCTILVTLTDPPHALMGKATVRAEDADGSELISITAAWQTGGAA